MSDNTQSSYANFNTLVVTGRISHVEKASKNGSTFLAISLLTNLQDDVDAVQVTFNTSNKGLMALYAKGFLHKGRYVTVTGKLVEFSELYFNKETGKRAVRKRPTMHLKAAQVLDGGLGPIKKDAVKAPSEVEVDEAPELEPAEY